MGEIKNLMFDNIENKLFFEEYKLEYLRVLLCVIRLHKIKKNKELLEEVEKLGRVYRELKELYARN